MKKHYYHLIFCTLFYFLLLLFSSSLPFSLSLSHFLYHPPETNNNFYSSSNIAYHEQCSQIAWPAFSYASLPIFQQFSSSNCTLFCLSNNIYCKFNFFHKSNHSKHDCEFFEGFFAPFSAPKYTYDK